MSTILLTGLDGSNPLGFLAGLGVLNVLSERTSGTPKLAWHTGDWRAIVTDAAIANADALISTLADDLKTWKDDRCLTLKYAKASKSDDSDAKKPGLAWDLKPPPGLFRSYLQELLNDTDPAHRRAADFAAAFATETAQDNNGNTKPTALHFTSARQQFLEMVAKLRAVTPNDLREALFGPWRYERLLPVLGWDCTAARAYALRADDPSPADRPGVPGADWLAFRGLSFIRVAPVGRRIATTGCSGGWKNGSFRWALWDAALEKGTVQIVLQMPRLSEMPEEERRARGISAVFSSAMRRSDPGGFGSFAPGIGV